MKDLFIDVQSYSVVNIGTAGSYRYIDDPSFELLLLSYAFDDGPVTVVDIARGEPVPQDFLLALSSPYIKKHAYNAAFEREVFRKWFNSDCPPEQWECDMIYASECGLPRSLKDVGKALRLPEDEQKMKEGRQLIAYFCCPCRPTKANGGRTRNLPGDAPDKWQAFKRYNERDVITERAIRRQLQKYEVPQIEWDAWYADQHINDRGVRIDRHMAQNAVAMSEAMREALTEEAKQITGLSNPNSVSQLKEFLELGDEATLRKADVAELLGTAEGTKKRILEIRKELGKSSVTKYEAMLRSACHDDRVRGTMAFYKANRTGRWAGSLIQPQNFPQNHIDELDEARQMVVDGDSKGIELMFGSVSDTLSQLIRTCIVPAPGKRFAVADFSAIEARVVAWLACEQWRMDVFANGGDIYCASASQMFHVPVEKHGVNGHLRQKGKIAELALGYGGSVGALTNMGALNMGLSEDELPDIVSKWRAASPNLVKLWAQMEEKFFLAMNNIGETFTASRGIEFFSVSKAMLEIRLPSGRALRYLRPRETTNRFGNPSISYEGNEAGKWGRVETFGGKLVENIVQALARDCLKECIIDLDKQLDIVFHVHDEMIVESDDVEAALKLMLQRMKQPVPWAPGLVLKGDGYTCSYYKKD